MAKDSELLSWSSAFSYQSIGFAFLRVWSRIAFSGAWIYLLATDKGTTRSVTQYISLILLVATMLACAFLASSSLMGRLLDKRRMPVIALVCFELSTICIFLCDAATLPGSILLYAGAVLSGVASGLFNILWGIAFTELDSRRALSTTLFGGVFCAMLLIMFVAFPTALMVAAALFCPFVTAWLLMKSEPDLGNPVLRQRCSKGLLRKLAKPLVSVFLFGVIAGLMHGIFFLNDSVAARNFSVLYFCDYVLIFLLVVAGSRLSGSFSFGKVYKPSILVASLGILAFPLLGLERAASYAIFYFGYAFFRVMIWPYLAHLANDLKTSAVLTYGLGWGLHYFGLLLGELLMLSPQLRGTIMSSPESQFVFAAILIFLVQFSFAFGFNDAFDLRVFAKSETADEATPAAGDIAGEVAVDAVATANESAEADDADSGKRMFQKRCDAVAEAYGLTAKEREVLALLARGWSSRMIQERLSVTASTVSSHCSNIYAKTGVHSKEQVMKLVASQDV
ncbi:MAG: hypothetical protein IJH83_03215 [Coriobacteriales bacterium]|nr:hypothetical protein [Coriobacteriales bacterium]